MTSESSAKLSDKCVRVGVTGHRFLAEPELIEAGIDRALGKIEECFSCKSLTVLSSLAEGADRLVANCVLRRRSTQLIAVLPFAKAEYMSDFASEESKREFLELLSRAQKVIDLAAKTKREEAYEIGGDYVLEHSDVLIAVWDGRAEQGRGGTAAMVARARRRKLPLVWVHAGNRKPGTTEPTSLGSEQGQVTLENF